MNLIATYWNKLYLFIVTHSLIVFILCNSLAMGCYLLLWRIVYGLFFSTVSSKAYFLFISLWMQPFKAWQSAFQKPITRSKALVFSSLVSKKIRWRVKFNVYNFFGDWKLNLVADCLFNKFTTGWINYTGCCENKYCAFFLFCLFSSVFFLLRAKDGWPT